ncbi:MAG: 7-cyano-7-deazaguanine synthase QueC [Alphaproteobacteria bacterium]|jgi:7-cyano-7-deazaguanine synthase|nr:7-cyano-7-deazaguanine synthase QueC [Alphaproteobacteria bacterium]
MKTVVVCSGGMDSVTLAYKVKRERELTRLVSFDYGQRHKKELDFAARTAADLGVRHDIIDIANIGNFLSGSALTGDIDVPDGHYAEDNMRVTVVPNRNAIMLTIAFGVAAGENASAVAAAVHAGDHFVYPDCRPAFVDAFRAMQNCALEGMWEVDLYTPFVGMSKADIARAGADLGVPFELTWSCYKGGESHCGRCGTCVERQEALHLAGVPDPTHYEDPDYWVEACKDRGSV